MSLAHRVVATFGMQDCNHIRTHIEKSCFLPASIANLVSHRHMSYRWIPITWNRSKFDLVHHANSFDSLLPWQALKESSDTRWERRTCSFYLSRTAMMRHCSGTVLRLRRRMPKIENLLATSFPKPLLHRILGQRQTTDRCTDIL